MKKLIILNLIINLIIQKKLLLDEIHRKKSQISTSIFSIKLE